MSKPEQFRKYVNEEWKARKERGREAKKLERIKVANLKAEIEAMFGKIERKAVSAQCWHQKGTFSTRGIY